MSSPDGSPAGRKRDGRWSSFTPRELDQAIRQSGSVPDLSHIRLAYLARKGGNSVVPKSSDPRVIEMTVEDGVQTVRIASSEFASSACRDLIPDVGTGSFSVRPGNAA